MPEPRSVLRELIEAVAAEQGAVWELLQQQYQDALVTSATGRSLDDLGDLLLEPVDYVSGSPATASLHRLVGTAPDGGRRSLFCKVLQHVRHWEALRFLPADDAEHFLASFPWRAELELWDPAVQATLPPGLRSPVLHGVVDLGDDRCAVWQEDVVQDESPWDDERFARAALLLGRWNARSSTPEVLASCPLPPGYALRMYAERSIPARGLVPLRDDALWSHPWLADHADLRAELLDLGEQVPTMLDRLDAFVQAMPHGDASPQNLLVPADEPRSFVVIDISFRSPHALGFDLSQLVLGLVHAGLRPAASVGATADLVDAAYLEGLHAEGIADQDDAVRDASATTGLLRSAFDGFRYDLLPAAGHQGTAEDRHAFDERLTMARALVGRYRALHPA